MYSIHQGVFLPEALSHAKQQDMQINI